jgi:hypothetical protein
MGSTTAYIVQSPPKPGLTVHAWLVGVVALLGGISFGWVLTTEQCPAGGGLHTSITNSRMLT